MSSKSTASSNPIPKKPTKSSLPADDVRQFRAALKSFLNEKDDEGRKWADAQWGVYAFYDYDGEPIYVGQTNEQLRVRIQRHLTNQRSDAVAMRILDVFEVAEVEVWPLWSLDVSDEPNWKKKRTLDACEYTAYINAIDESRFKAILNEKIPPRSDRVELPSSLRRPLIDDETRADRGHLDIRIARRAETIGRLAAVARERGEVSEGLRRVLVVQAVRLAFLAAERLAYVEARPAPDAGAIDIEKLVGSVLYERSDPKGESRDPNDATI
ncbi:excinuclease ABC subunit C [Mycobacterium sp. IS-1496]|uniref:GIY-YIG nuclease family protein n=1 Tax=Mycobacterium sp. IS-1496 TaxID=1772284 RepID=UPI00074175A6|nr:GIY-YIG nuclease family protein [Mycobacterium sp. IS-1496]KUI34699.1 excinuclease ABC subunit C [Mycobacterium sp. IS-1496]